jgi:GAF domain-containing protein/HAMP domain-containing protein
MTEVTATDGPRRTIRQRIIQGNIIIGVLLVVAGIIAIWQVNRLAAAVRVLQVARERAVVASQVRQDSTDLIAAIGRLLPVEEAGAFEAEVGTAVDALRESSTKLDVLAQEATEDEAAYTLLTRVNSRMDQVIGIADTMLRQATAGQWPSARVRMGVLLRDQQELANQTDRLVNLAREVEDEAVEEVSKARRAAVLYPALVMVLALELGVLLTWQTTRRIAGPVERLTQGVTKVAAGSLGERIAVESEDELGQLAAAFNQMAEQLQTLYGGLEQRVAERTADLERRAVQLQTAAEVARDAASVLDPRELMERVVSLISERFGFYHAGLFLLDEARRWAVLQTASSQGGQRMLARGHRLEVGETGIVGYVTGTGEPRVALDVGADAVFFDNPDLPYTRSEMALPLRVRGEVVGALDVQSTEPAAFTDEDVAVLQILADQVAVAIENTRLYRQAQQSLEAVERAYGEFGREAWLELVQRGQVRGYRYGPAGFQVDPQAWSPDMAEALEKEQSILSAGDLASLAIPLRIRGQTIGVLDITKPEGADPWTNEDIALLEALTDQMGQALESTRLYQDTQRRAVQEQAIRRVTERMRRSVDVEAILQHTVAELARALGAPRAYVRLGTETEWEAGDALQGGDGRETRGVAVPVESESKVEGGQHDVR